VIQTWLVGMVYYGGSKSSLRIRSLTQVYFTPLYLQNVRGFGIIESAALLLPLVLSQVITTVISGYVIKWTGHARKSFSVGFVVWLAGQGAQLSFDRSTTKGAIVGCLLVQGLGIGATIQSSQSSLIVAYHR
jgi:Na+/melibiose symporter-like transporter